MSTPIPHSSASLSAVSPALLAEQQRKRQAVARWLINHLEAESAFLDVAIANGLLIKSLLQEKSPTTTSRVERLAELRNEVHQQFGPVQHGRSRLNSVLQSLPPESALKNDAPSSPRLYDLIRKLDEPERGRLKSLRCEITEKLQEFLAISTANQAVLFYLLEFHSRLLAGYKGSESESESYDASGRSNRNSSHSLIHANF